MQIAKAKMLISFTVTAELICVFVFAYAKCRFSHDAAHIICVLILPLKHVIHLSLANTVSAEGRLVQIKSCILQNPVEYIIINVSIAII